MDSSRYSLFLVVVVVTQERQRSVIKRAFESFRLDVWISKRAHHPGLAEQLIKKAFFFFFLVAARGLGGETRSSQASAAARCEGGYRAQFQGPVMLTRGR